MVALVLVSHSRELASALARYLEQVSPLRVPLAVASGLGSGELGTDALSIAQAIQSVVGPDGVLVLMDLGSAVLAAEAALELLPEEARTGVRLCPAPLVEGAIAAAVRIAAGGGLEEAFREAAGALSPKTVHLAVPGSGPERSASAVHTEEGYQELAATVRNAHGLHLRPAARLVHAAARFRAEVLVANPQSGKPPVSAASLNGITTLGLTQGDRILFRARGPEARQALEALRRLAEEAFGEQPAPAEEASPAPPAAEPGERPGPVAGIPVSEGFAAGPLLFAERTELNPSERSPLAPGEEWGLLEDALSRERAILKQERLDITARAGPDKGALFEAFRLILQDPALLDLIREAIFTRRRNAEQALSEGIQATADRYRNLADPYARQRAADIQDLGQRMLRRLRRVEDRPPAEAGPVILAVRELSPSAAVRLDARNVRGVLTVLGGATSHSAVLVRSLGIPCVGGIPESMLRLPAGTVAAMDGGAGKAWIAPDAQTLARIEAGRAEWLNRRAAAAAQRREPAVSRDGRRFEVEANIAGVAEARAAVEQGAEGVGVLRTEFLFLDRASPPTEAEQLEALREISERLEGRPLTVRTLDVGGDKTVPYLAQTTEANPYLGVRGIRLCLLRKDLFQVQLRAILRAGDRHDVRLLFPMITTREELERALRELAQARSGLERDGVPHRWPIPVGMMVETPSAALLIDAFLERVDFVSIGTNDLTQYTLAADRGNPALAGYEDALHPAVLALIRRVAAAAARSGRRAAVCGEIAGDPLALPVLAGLGVASFSLNADRIPRVKETLRRLNVASAARRAGKALRSFSAAEVRRLASDFFETLPPD